MEPGGLTRTSPSAKARFASSQHTVQHAAAFARGPRTTVSATTAGTIRKRLSFACCTVKLLTTTTEPTTELA